MPDAEPQEEVGYGEAEAEGGPVDGGLASEEAPAEAIDDADHGIQRVEEAVLLGDDAGTETDWRNIKPELDDEGDDGAEIPVFDIQRGEPEAGPEGGKEGEENEDGEEEELPAGEEQVLAHYAGEDDKADEEINKRDDDGGSGDDEPREVNLADEVGIADEAIGGLGQGGGEEGPRQHAGKNHQRIRSGPLGGEFGNLSKDDGEDDHTEEGGVLRPKGLR